MFGRLNYREVVSAEAERRMAHGEEPEDVRRRARQDPLYRKSENYRWAVIQAVMRDFELPGAYHRALVANAPALSKQAKKLEEKSRDRFEHTDYRSALRDMKRALELERSESREGMAEVLAARVRHEDRLMLAEVPSLADVMRDTPADDS